MFGRPNPDTAKPSIAPFSSPYAHRLLATCLGKFRKTKCRAKITQRLDDVLRSPRGLATTRNHFEVKHRPICDTTGRAPSWAARGPQMPTPLFSVADPKLAMWIIYMSITGVLS